MLEVYRGDSKNLALNFAQDDGTPLNVSGCGVFFVAAVNYVEHPIIYIGTTGTDAAAVTGLVNLTLSPSDTNHCAGDYLASFRLACAGSTGTYPSEGLRILPNLLPLE